MSYRFTPIQQGAGLAQIVAMINRNFQKLDREAVTKIVKGPNNTEAALFGMRDDGTFGVDFYDKTGVRRAALGQTDKGFGLILYDLDGTARLLTGNSPDDGRIGEWLSRPGDDVLDLLGGG